MKTIRDELLCLFLNLFCKLHNAYLYIKTLKDFGVGKYIHRYQEACCQFVEQHQDQFLTFKETKRETLCNQHKCYASIDMPIRHCGICKVWASNNSVSVYLADIMVLEGSQKMSFYLSLMTPATRRHSCVQPHAQLYASLIGGMCQWDASAAVVQRQQSYNGKRHSVWASSAIYRTLCTVTTVIQPLRFVQRERYLWKRYIVIHRIRATCLGCSVNC